MDLDRIDWTVYRKEDTGNVLKNPHFYFCLVFGVLFFLLLVSCSSPSKTTTKEEPVRTYEPGYLRR
jgi:hypothetical protein